MTHAAAATRTLRSLRRRPHGPAAWECAFFELLGYRPGERFAIIPGPSEAGGGALLALAGPGSVSADNVLGLEWSAAWCLGGVALGVAAAIATLLMRRAAAAQPAPASRYDKPLGKVA